MRVGQPGVQRRQADFGAVAEQQEHESDIEQGGIELRRFGHQHGPHHGVQTFADHRTRRHVDQDGAEQRQRDADAAENEIFPGRFQRLVCAINADHQNGGERRDLDRHPHQADIVGDQRQAQGEHQCLIHGVIEAHESRRQPADLDLVADVARAEHGCGEADESREHDENLVEVVDQQIRTGLRLNDKQGYSGRKTQKRRQHIEPGGQPIAGQRGQQGGRYGRDQQNAGERIESSPLSAEAI